jgi:hypothetical protein
MRALTVVIVHELIPDNTPDELSHHHHDPMCFAVVRFAKKWICVPQAVRKKRCGGGLSM